MKQITSLNGFTHFQLKLLRDAILDTFQQYVFIQFVQCTYNLVLGFNDPHSATL